MTGPAVRANKHPVDSSTDCVHFIHGHRICTSQNRGHAIVWSASIGDSVSFVLPRSFVQEGTAKNGKHSAFV